MGGGQTGARNTHRELLDVAGGVPALLRDEAGVLVAKGAVLAAVGGRVGGVNEHQPPLLPRGQHFKQRNRLPDWGWGGEGVSGVSAR
jgi:hypothetical protein